MTKTPLWQTITVGTGVAILLGLGTWQVQRLQWKDDIIQRLERDYTAMEGKNASLLPSSRLQALGQEEQPMAVGALRGTFLREDAILLGPVPHEGRIGYHLLMPLSLSDGRAIIVNAGWVDAIWKDDPESRYAGLPQESVTVMGILRKPDWNSFTSKNSPANDMWFRADIEEITKEKNLDSVYPFVLYANSTRPALQDVTPLDEHWLPRNKHMQYALFWYAMAAALIGVYIAYRRSTRK